MQLKRIARPCLSALGFVVLAASPGAAQDFEVLTPVQHDISALQTVSLPYTKAVTQPGFQGLGVGFPGFTVQFAPPDTNAAVGPNHIVQWVNGQFAIFNHAGTVL